jgi:hypothetical protein
MRTLTVGEDPELGKAFALIYLKVKDAKDAREIAAIIRQIAQPNKPTCGRPHHEKLLFGLIFTEQQQLPVRRRKNIVFKNQQFFLLSDLKLNRCFKKQKEEG